MYNDKGTELLQTWTFKGIRLQHGRCPRTASQKCSGWSFINGAGGEGNRNYYRSTELSVPMIMFAVFFSDCCFYSSLIILNFCVTSFSKFWGFFFQLCMRFCSQSCILKLGIFKKRINLLFSEYWNPFLGNFQVPEQPT